MRGSLLLILCSLSACTVGRVEERFAARGHVINGSGPTQRPIGGALIQACSVNPISFSRFLSDPTYCLQEELVRSAPDGSFAITSHKEWRLRGLLFGPPHGSGEDYIYTVLVACHKDDFLGHADVKDANATDIQINTFQKQGPESIDVQRCSTLWKRNLTAP